MISALKKKIVLNENKKWELTSDQSPGAIEQCKTFEGLKVSKNLPTCLISVLVKLWYLFGLVSEMQFFWLLLFVYCYFCRYAGNRAEVCSILGSGGKALCACWGLLSLCLLPALMPFLRSSPGTIKLISCLLEREGRKGVIKAHRVRCSDSWGLYHEKDNGCIVQRIEYFRDESFNFY